MAAVQAFPPGTTGRLFIFGLGNVAGDLARKADEAGWSVFGTSTSQEGADQWCKAGIKAFVFSDETELSAEALQRLRESTHVLSSVPPQPGKSCIDPVIQRCGEMLKGKSWVGYLSSSGVYGDAQGRWVNEQSPLHPNSGTAKNRLEAESLWASLPGQPVHIFRLAGLYGPSRCALQTASQGVARIVVKDNHYLNRVHISDAASACLLSMQKPKEKTTYYNVADNFPCPQAEVNTLAYSLMKMPVPDPVSYEEAVRTGQISNRMQEFYECSRRLDNSLLKSDLGWQPQFPSYKEGL
eukprot:gene6266-9604_t